MSTPSDHRPSRRSFLRRAGFAAVSGLALSHLPPFLHVAFAEDENQDIFRQKISWAGGKNLSEKPLGTIMAEIGGSFLGAPYIAHSLEVPGEEHLVVNLGAFDCVTFVESTFALSRCVKLRKTEYADFTRELQTLRYRNGVIHGYSSRLHYFTDWILDNERKKLVRNVTLELGGHPVHKTFDIMSTHRSDYPRLTDESVFREIRAAEKRLSRKSYAVIPRSEIGTAEGKLRNGDIIALATSIAGIDVTHTGLAVVSDGAVRYLHAPLSGGKVSLSEDPLSRYVSKGSPSLTGIVVARPLEPRASR